MDPFSRLAAAVAGAVLALAAAVPARAATVAPFTQSAFVAAEQEGRPILLHIEAPWCSTCAQQRPILSHIEAEPRFAQLVVYDVDFDHQKDVVRALGVRMQSTLIAMRGSAEQGRSTGDTAPASIEALVAKTLP